VVLGLAVIGTSQAAGHGSPVSRGGHQGYANYHLADGRTFEHGYFYEGKYHKHWSYSYWDKRYGSYLYYDPCCSSYCYRAPKARNYPVRPSRRRGSLRLWNSQLTTDRPRRVVIHLAVTRDGRLMVVRWVHPHRVPPSLPEQPTTMLAEVPEQVLTLHDTTPAGTSRTSELAPKWR